MEFLIVFTKLQIQFNPQMFVRKRCRAKFWKRAESGAERRLVGGKNPPPTPPEYELDPLAFPSLDGAQANFFVCWRGAGGLKRNTHRGNNWRGPCLSTGPSCVQARGAQKPTNQRPTLAQLLLMLSREYCFTSS